MCARITWYDRRDFLSLESQQCTAWRHGLFKGHKMWMRFRWLSSCCFIYFFLPWWFHTSVHLIKVVILWLCQLFVFHAVWFSSVNKVCYQSRQKPKPQMKVLRLWKKARQWSVSRTKPDPDLCSVHEWGCVAPQRGSPLFLVLWSKYLLCSLCSFLVTQVATDTLL